MCKKQILLTVFSCIGFCTTLLADIKLPSYIGSNMVLQQKALITMEGTANANSKVILSGSWQPEKHYVTFSDKNGHWLLNFRTPKAGGPYSITISDGEALELQNVLLGEVWLCAGQSNMEMPMRGFKNQPIKDSEKLLQSATINELRLFKVDTAVGLLPKDNVVGEWTTSTPQTAKEFSAVAWQFGKALQEQLNVPIGLVFASVGGVKIQSWMSAESLQNFPEFPIPTSLEGIKEPFKEPTTLFNGMIAPLKNLSFKGLIWFQGESNRHEVAAYENLFPAMVNDWREYVNNNFPIYYVQIAPAAIQDHTRDGAGLRQAQLNCLKKIKRSGIVITLDLGEEKVIHFANKTSVATRLANLALHKSYKLRNMACYSPQLKSVRYTNHAAILTFKFAYKGLESTNNELTNFEVADSTQQLFAAHAAIIRKNKIKVWAEQVNKPIRVNYAYKDWVIGDLFNSVHLPASSFKTNKP